MAVQLQLLGLPRLLVDGRTVAVSWPRRTLALLTFLFTSRGAQPRDAAAFALWPDDDEEAARANLRRNLNALRGVLPESVQAWVVADAGSIAFHHEHADTDVAVFESAVTDPADLRAAAAIYGGDFAASIDDPWVLTERERLRARFHAILVDLAGMEFSARRFESALVYARRIVADEPFREDIARRIIAIRYAMGDRPGALAEFERFARSLRTEMNIDPMPETFGLRDLVLRGESLPFAPDAAVAARVPGIGTTAPLLPFTGREAALERLVGAWRSASNGDGTMVFLGGEAGIGKTRTVAEFLERTVGTSARIFRGTTASPEARPYEALLQALGGAAPFVSTLDIEPVWLASLALLVPEIGARCPATASRAPLPPDREVLRLFESFVRFAAALARGRAVVIVLEDLHWSGAGTLDALRYMAARLHGHRILLVGTYRSGESSAGESLVRDLCTSHHAVAVPLARLSSPETLAMLGRVEPPVSAADVAELAQRSEGHPLFLTELLRDYPQARHLAGAGIVEIVAARLTRCSQAAQTLAHIAASCGTTFDLDLLRCVAGWDDGALIDGLAELLERQFIRSTAAHERGSYTFTHALVRMAVIGATDALEERRIHRIAARALETRGAAAKYDAEIARHWAQAGEPGRAAQAYLRAARESLTVGAREEAATLATAGLEVASEPRTREALVTTRITANLRRIVPERLRADATLLARIASELDAQARFTSALLAVRIEECGGDIDSRITAARALRECTSAVTDDAGSVLCEAQLAETDAKNDLMLGRLRSAIAHATRARERFAAGGHTSDELRATILVASVQARLGDLAQALADLIEIEPRIVACADPALAMDYWYARTTVPHAQRNVSATLHAAERVRSIACAAGDRWMEGHAALMTAAGYQHASALTRSLAELDRADDIYRSIGALLPRNVARNNRASVLLQIGRIEEATLHLQALYDEAKISGADETVYFAASNLGCALLAAGDVARALGLQREALSLARAIGSESFAALALGDLGAAEIAARDAAAGIAHLLEAAAINRQVHRPAVLAHDLARAAGAEPAPERGAVHAREALALVEADPGAVALAPEILSRCAQAFESARDVAAAAYCRRRGRELLDARVTALEGTDRDRYLALPWHRSLFEVAAAAAGRR